MNDPPPEAFGPYLVYEQLGRGGMAQVHRAVVAGIEGFERPVALKRMLPHLATNQDSVRAFVREARLASYLRHANVAQTYELGKVDDIYFIAMELVTGHTLRAVLRHCAQTTGPMPVPIALNIINQLCDALDYAHNLCDETGQPLGIIHRDVSPSNIILAEGGVVKLIDFGIAKASAAGMQTQSGTIKGKFGYMAPEYIGGRIDARADLFALGVISHELLTNRPLFTSGDDMQTLHRVRSMPLVPPSQKNPQVPAEIDDIVMTALARNPDRRWQHATALRTAMTTLTKRLGLEVNNQQVMEWIEWAFDQTKPRMQRTTSQPVQPEAADQDPSISIMTSEVPPAQPEPSAGTSQNMTLIMQGGSPDPPTQTPIGTPSHAMLAQDPPRALGADEYRAAVAAYSRHSGLVPTGNVVADETAPTLIRPSVPRIEAQVRPVPEAVDPMAQPRPRSATHEVPGQPRPRSITHDVPNRGINATLIDGAVGPSKQLLAVRPYTPPSEPPNQRIAQPAPVPPPVAPAAPERRIGTALAVVLVLVAAAVAAAVVYFVLPLVT